MAPTNPSPSVARIVDAAVLCVGRQGFDRTSMKDIADAAGVSKALVHYHFQTKQQLFLEVQTRAFRELVQGLEAPAEGDNPSVDQAMTGVDGVWEILKGLQSHIPLTLEMWSQATRRTDVRAQLREFHEETVALAKRGLRATLGRQSDPGPGMPTDRLARALVAILFGLATHAHLAPDAETAEALYQDIRALFEAALTQMESTA